MSTLGKGLSIDEREALGLLVQDTAWPALLKLIDQLAYDQETAVLRALASDGAEKLMALKLRAEGARKLATDIEALKAKFKNPDAVNSQHRSKKV